MSNAIAVRNGTFGRIGLYELDRPIVDHAHRESHLVFYLEGGAANATVCGQPLSLAPGKGVAVNPMEMHRFSPSESKKVCICLVLYLSPYWILSSSRSMAQVLRFGSNALPVRAALLRLIRRLADTICKDGEAGSLDTLLYDIYRQSYQASWLHADKANATDIVSGCVIKSMDLMKKDFLRDSCIESLPKIVGLSRPQFFLRFKREVGVTPNIYLNTLRVEQAIYQLTSTAYSIEQISSELGFSAQSSFSRFFSQNVGVPPSVYRDASSS